jgi:hypothetical protein
MLSEGDSIATLEWQYLFRHPWRFVAIQLSHALNRMGDKIANEKSSLHRRRIGSAAMPELFQPGLNRPESISLRCRYFRFRQT